MIDDRVTDCKTHIHGFPTTAAAARAAAEQFVEIATMAIAARGQFSVALSGGSTPAALYQLLAGEPYVSTISWPNVHIFWGDERTVPPDHADSNYRMAEEALLSKVPIPPQNVYRMLGERKPQKAAADYEWVLGNHFGGHRHIDRDIGAPRFDLVLLGMGDDGHTASLFPDSDAVHQAVAGAQQHWVVANYVDKFAAWRMTLTAFVINAAAHVTFLVAGGDKAAVLRQVLVGPRQPLKLPSQLIKPTDGVLTWVVDDAAASLLRMTDSE